MSSSFSNTKTSLRRLIQRSPGQSRSPSTATATTTKYGWRTREVLFTSHGAGWRGGMRELEGSTAPGPPPRRMKGGGRAVGGDVESAEWRATSSSSADVRSSHSHTLSTFPPLFFLLICWLSLPHSLTGVCHSGPTLATDCFSYPFVSCGSHTCCRLFVVLPTAKWFGRPLRACTSRLSILESAGNALSPPRSEAGFPNSSGKGGIARGGEGWGWREEGSAREKRRPPCTSFVFHLPSETERTGTSHVASSRRRRERRGEKRRKRSREGDAGRAGERAFGFR